MFCLFVFVFFWGGGLFTSLSLLQTHWDDTQEHNNSWVHVFIRKTDVHMWSLHMKSLHKMALS